MILRRVVESLRQQHWTAVFIELVIVVLGVFIGMQVSNWNAEREDNRKSAIFTSRLEQDLRAEAWGVQFLTEYNKEVLRNADEALKELSGEASMTDGQFLIHAYRATQFVFNTRYRTTYDELVSTGDMGLITDSELRQTAIDVFTTPIFGQIADDGRKSEYRRIFRRTVAHDVQNDLLKRCGDRSIKVFEQPLVGLLDYPCALGVSAVKTSAAVKALREDKDFVPALRLRFADVQTNLADLELNDPAIFKDLMKYSQGQP